MIVSMLKRDPRFRDQAREELVEGLGHLRSATAHAAAEAKKQVVPAVDNALVAVGLRKRPRRRWPWIVGTAVAVTAAVGAAGVILWKRGNEQALEDDLFADEPDAPQAEDLAYDTPTLDKRTDAMAGATTD